MQSRYFSTTALLLATVVIAACSKQHADVVPAQSAASVSQSSVASASDALQGWLGKWDGVEGTYELVAKSDSKYDVIIKDLDREHTFAGIGSVDRVIFERDGEQEQIRATDGDHTGMKWLAGKANCLMVRVGEGYCRD